MMNVNTFSDYTYKIRFSPHDMQSSSNAPNISLLADLSLLYPEYIKGIECFD